MYTDEDLNNAIKTGVFSQSAVDTFRLQKEKTNHTNSVDEENFRLISGFNDIFVVIACLLLLSSSAWVCYSISPPLAMGVVAILSWGLAEFFVRKRQMSLPAIVLLLSFVGSIFVAFNLLFNNENFISLSAAIAAFSAWLHWRRFHVPITVAAGMIAIVSFALSLFFTNYPSLDDVALSPLIFIAGLITFLIAMHWDSADRQRITQKADVAFWLHLLAAPLMVHPIFLSLGVADNNVSFSSIIIIVLLYLTLCSISLIIDRRAFMVSSLIYVLYAFNTLFKTYGLAGDSLALSGVFIGFSLLLLSGYWSSVRNFILNYLPNYVLQKIPTLH